MLLPIWLGAMVGYKLGLYSRQALKSFGLRLFLGGGVREGELIALGESFADHVVPRWVAPGAASAIAQDQAEQRELVLVTAAMAFYAEPIGQRLQFAQVIGTGHALDKTSGTVSVEGDNCYGPAKVERVTGMLEARAIDPDGIESVFYSDSASDAPLFNWCDEAVFVNGSPRAQAKAHRRGWRTARF